jgi:CubicO group peptidase (beta-lactamase class C family)
MLQIVLQSCTHVPDESKEPAMAIPGRSSLARRWLVPAATAGVLFLSGAQGSTVAKQGAPQQGGSSPVFSDTGPEASDFGAGEGFPVGTKLTFTQIPHLVGAFSHFDQLFPARMIPRSKTPWSFRRAATEPTISYVDRGSRRSILDYLARNPITGLLIARDDTILFEHYQYGRTDRDRLLSQSMAKSITAMLVGVAVGEHAIASIDDRVADYVPALEVKEYGKTSIRDLLHMASGVQFKEDYGGQDDDEKFEEALLFGGAEKSTAEIIAQFDTRVAEPGTKWNYAATEPDLLGLVLRAATEMPVADYLHARIWEPMGAEADASWILDGSAQEMTHGFVSAVLRDYARFGRLLAHDGAWQGRQLIPRQWVLDATTVRASEPFLAPGHLMPGLVFGYGYLVWILPGPERRFAMMGTRGQAVFVDPSTKLVMVQTAVRKTFTSPWDETLALWGAVVEQLGQEKR